MLELIKFVLTVFGLVALVSAFSIKVTLLNRKPFICPLCMGFWIGGTFAFILNLEPIWVWAFIGASSSWILNSFVTGEY